jgi:hypothetical protein
MSWRPLFHPPNEAAAGRNVAPCLAGIACGIAGLGGLSRVGARRVMWPAMAGITANLLLLSVFMAHLVTARSAASNMLALTGRANPHLGIWHTRIMNASCCMN